MLLYRARQGTHPGLLKHGFPIQVTRHQSCVGETTNSLKNHKEQTSKGTTCTGKGKKKVMIQQGSNEDIVTMSSSSASEYSSKGDPINLQNQELAPIRVIRECVLETVRWDILTLLSAQTLWPHKAKAHVPQVTPGYLSKGHLSHFFPNSCGEQGEIGRG